MIANATQQVMLVFDEFKRRPGTGQNADEFADDARRYRSGMSLLVFPTPPLKASRRREMRSFWSA